MAVHCVENAGSKNAVLLALTLLTAFLPDYLITFQKPISEDYSPVEAG